MLIKRIQFLFFGVLLFCSPLVCNAGVTRAEAEATIVEHTVKAAEDALATLQSINDRRSADMKALQYYGEIWGMNLYLYNSFNPDVNKAATRKLTEEIFPAIKKVVLPQNKSAPKGGVASKINAPKRYPLSARLASLP